MTRLKMFFPSADRPRGTLFRIDPGRLEALGVVWIALVLLAVQLLHPFGYAYEYRSSLVLSENRLRQLQTYIETNLQSDQSTFRLKLGSAPDASGKHGAPLASSIPNLHSRAITIRSVQPIDSAALTRILATASYVQDVDAAAILLKAARWNRHCIAVFEHQAKLLAPREADTVAAEPPPAGRLQLASSVTRFDPATERSGSASLASVSDKLEALRSDQQGLDRKLSQRQNFASGVISVSKPWSIHVSAADTDRGRLLLALIGSCIAAIIAQTFVLPTRVVLRRTSAQDIIKRQLQSMRLDLLPMIGHIAEETVRVTSLPIPATRRETLYRASKGLIIVALALVMARMLFDPLWRELCLDSPLAALSALIDFQLADC